jgi:hypothetical protein
MGGCVIGGGFSLVERQKMLLASPKYAPYTLLLNLLKNGYSFP